MSTTYILHPGYNSSHTPNDVWEQMLFTVSEIQADPSIIYNELCYEEKQWYDEEDWMEYCNAYRNNDLTLKIHEEEQTIRQCASGGGDQRDMKEACRRAVCRLIITECHRRGMEVSMEVV